VSSPSAVVYCRISQDRTGEGGGVERQRADCEKLAADLGYDIVRVYTDNDVSAYSGKPRPEYRAMLRHLSQGSVDALLAWHTDRLYRSIPDLSELVAICDEHDVAIRTVRSGPVDLTTPSGRLSATMFAGIARYEVERSAERLKSAKAQQAREGRFRGGPRPFGYLDGGLKLHNGEADRLRSAAEHLLAGGSLMSVTRRWNDEGFTTARGARWTVTGLRKVLTRARNAGLVEQAGVVVGEAKWPAIFDVDTLHAVRAIVADPRRRTAVSFERKHQGSGVYRCGKCGAPMKIFKGAGGGRDYRCVETPHLSQRQDPLDEYISELVIGRLSMPDAALPTPDKGPDVADLRSRRDGLQARKDELAGLFAAGSIDASQLSRGSADLQVQIDRLEHELVAARQDSPLADALGSDDVRSYWQRASADTRAKIIDALMTVTVEPTGPGNRPRGWTVADRVRVEWR
jgi:DNA invertase Pin-like site-specific DNA recombinase